MQTKKLISIVIPVFNEEENVRRAYLAICDAFRLLTSYDFEIVFTDNHSTDATFQKISEIALQDPRVRYFRFSRNFGYQRSILTGFLQAKGHAAVQFDCDLQDPPELIGEFIQQWEKGYRVVYGVRTQRQEPKHIEWLRKVFYRMIDLLSEYPLPKDAGDFRLIDRSVIEQLKGLEDQSPYLRGFFAEIGFEQIGVPYSRRQRTHGISKFPFREMAKLALDGVLNHSTLPLRLATWVGLGMTVVTTVGMGIFFVGRLLKGDQWPAGFTTLVLLILLSISLNSLFLGILGEYLGRVFRQTKKRPVTIIEKTINAEPQEMERPASVRPETARSLPC